MAGRARTKYTERDIRDAVSSSFTIADVLRRLGLVPAGGNYELMWQRIERLGLDASHLRRVSRRKVLANVRPLPSGQLVRAGDRLRKLIADGLLAARCQHCQRDTWLGQPIPLELDHIDGNRTNNAIENLRPLCPNCHSRTPKYHGRRRAA